MFAKALNRIADGMTTVGDDIYADSQKRRNPETSMDDYNAKLARNNDLSNSKKILVIRGFVAYAFDPVDGAWTRLADSRRDRSYFETCRVDGYVYALGTYNITAAGTVERLGLAENKWEICSELPVKLRSFSAAAVGDKIHLAGGIDVTSMEASTEVYEFDPKANDGVTIGRWTKAERSLLVARYRHAAVVFQGHLWLIGGIVKNIYDQEEYTSTTEVMDLASGGWSPGPSTCARRAIDVCPLIVDGRLYLVGGDMKGVVHRSNACDKQSADMGTIERYDPETSQFVTVTRFRHQRRGFSAAAMGDMIYIFGGRDGDRVSVSPVLSAPLPLFMHSGSSVYIHTHTLTHSLTHLDMLTHTRTYLLPHPPHLTPSPLHPLTPSPPHPLTPSPPHPLRT